MATVTGYTAERMKVIEDTTVVGGNVVGDNLILTKRDASVINAGSVRGPQGIQGVPGEVSLATLKARVPAGSVLMWMFETLPNGWLSINGQAIANADTTYPDLWAAAPASWKSGTTLTFPNMLGRSPVHRDPAQSEFAALGQIGGAKSQTLVKGNVPKHTHGINHDHPATSVTGAAHTHSINHDHGSVSLTIANNTHTHTFKRTLNPGTTSKLFDMQNIAVVGSFPTTGDPGYLWGNTEGVGRLPSTTGHWGNGETFNEDTTHSHTGTADLPNFSGTSGSTTPSGGSVDLPNFTGTSEDGTAAGLGSTAFSLLNPYFVLRFIIKT